MNKVPTCAGCDFCRKEAMFTNGKKHNYCHHPHLEDHPGTQKAVDPGQGNGNHIPLLVSPPGTAQGGIAYDH